MAAERRGRNTGPLLLFVSGEPFEDAIPGGARRRTRAWIAGGMPVGSVSWGGHEAADLEPGQLYGPSARIGRMVLAMANERRLTVKVVDVNRPGDDRPLLGTYGIDDSVLPVLVRSDGARLVGESAFDPGPVERFLDGY